jgi:hypothetical protein
VLPVNNDLLNQERELAEKIRRVKELAAKIPRVKELAPLAKFRRLDAQARRGDKPFIGRVLPGQRIGLWSVTERFERRADSHLYRLCICSCGTERYVYEHDLWKRKSTSCGKTKLHLRASR